MREKNLHNWSLAGVKLTNILIFTGSWFKFTLSNRKQTKNDFTALSLGYHYFAIFEVLKNSKYLR